MNKKNIGGIQQAGIGVPDIKEAWKWYIDHFGVDVRIFEEAAVAELMLPYTGGKPQKRHAALAMNMQGGGGFEIWQYMDRKPLSPIFELQLGDLGIYSVKIKSKDIKATYQFFKEKGTQLIGDVSHDVKGKEHFFLKDLYQNVFQMVPSNNWFRNERKLTGAVYGAIIGVSDMNKSIPFYQEILNYDQIIYDETGSFDDFSVLPGGRHTFRRVLLRHSKERVGPFSLLFGNSEIELIQVLDREPKKIYEKRFWGDIGFIHLCFDINGMSALREECKQRGFPFTVDTGDTFDMGEASGAFSYTEDPDGTLIEFVETHKIPVIKKIGFYFNLKKRPPGKSLPRWMLNALSLNRVKNL